MVMLRFVKPDVVGDCAGKELLTTDNKDVAKQLPNKDIGIGFSTCKALESVKFDNSTSILLNMTFFYTTVSE